MLIHCPNRALDKILSLGVLLWAAGSVVTSIAIGVQGHDSQPPHPNRMTDIRSEMHSEATLTIKKEQFRQYKCYKNVLSDVAGIVSFQNLGVFQHPATIYLSTELPKLDH